MSPLAATGPNAEQIEYWNEQSGPEWVARGGDARRADRAVRRAAMERAQIAPGERVLDVGCGCGETTLAARGARGPRGSVLGVDISAVDARRARASARRERALAHVRLRRRRRADARSTPARFDLRLLALRRDVLRRSGRGLREPARAPRSRRAGRVRVLAGAGAQSLDARAAAGRGTPPAAATPPAPGAPGPFAFADAARVRGILERAGFREVAIDPFESLLDVGGAGGTLDQAVELVMGLGPLGLALREASAELRRRVTAAVREALVPHATPAGVKLGSAAWIVRAV